MDKEKLIIAYMKEYEMTREAAEKRADQTIEKIKEIYPDEVEAEENEEEEGEIFWDVSELICVKCLERWIAVRPSTTLLKHIECPRCRYIGSSIETGQEFYLDDIEGIDGLDEEEEG